MNTSPNKRKVALLVNTISPARVALFSGLARQFDLLILHGGMEANRDSWHDIDKRVPNAKVKRAWGWKLQIAIKIKGKFYDYKFLHITPGIIWHLLVFRPEILITNEMGFRTIVALGYGIVFRKPVWVWWGGTTFTERAISRPRRLLRRVISSVVKHWISYGKSSTEYLLSLGINAHCILEIQNTVDERQFAIGGEPGFPLEPRPILLHVGQLIGRKGIELFLKAASTVQKSGTRFSILFVGSGPDRKALDQLVKGLSLEHVHFQSSLVPEQMPSVYRSADVLIFPTLEDVWGLVANEAVLSGLPVLCSKYAGCADELFSPENIFDPLNHDEFTQKLRLAIAGQLPRTSPRCLKTIRQLVQTLVTALENSASSGSEHSAPVKLRRVD